MSLTAEKLDTLAPDAPALASLLAIQNGGGDLKQATLQQIADLFGVDANLIHVNTREDIGAIPVPLAITSFEDLGGGETKANVSGTNTLFSGQRVTFSGGTDYDGSHDITRIDATSFKFTTAFIGATGGTATALKRQAEGANIFKILKTFDWTEPLLITKGTGFFGLAKFIAEDVNLHEFNVTYTDTALGSPIQVVDGDASILTFVRQQFIANATLKAADIRVVSASLDPNFSVYSEEQCVWEDFALPVITNASFVTNVDRTFYRGNKIGYRLIDCKDVRFDEVSWTTEEVASDAFMQVIETGAFVGRYKFNIEMVLKSGEFGFFIDGANFDAGSRLTVNNSDINEAGTMFQTTPNGLDQTDPRIISNGNPGQKNSMVVADMRSTRPMTALINTLHVDEQIQDLIPAPGDFVVTSSVERVIIDDETGQAIYQGLRPITIAIEYLGDFSSGGADAEFVTSLYIGGIRNLDSLFTLLKSTGSRMERKSIYELQPGDTINLNIRRNINTTNIDFSNIQLLISGSE